MKGFSIPKERSFMVPYHSAPGSAVKISVLASKPVDVYVIDAAQKEAYVTGQGSVQPLALSQGNSTHNLLAFLSVTSWFLIIENSWNDEEVTGSFSVEIPNGPGSPSGMMGPVGATGATGATGSFSF